MAEEEPNYEMFLAHGERPVLTDTELSRLYDVPDDLSPAERRRIKIEKRRLQKQSRIPPENPPYDEKKYFIVPDDDDNIYVTFSKINESLYPSSISIILSAFDSNIVLSEPDGTDKNIVKILFNHHIKEIIRTGPVTEEDVPRYDRYHMILIGIMIYGFIRNLVNIGRTHFKFEEYDLNGTIRINKYLDIDTMFVCTFDEIIDIDFTKHFNEKTFQNIKIDFGNAIINEFYHKVISFYDIDNLLCSLFEGVDMNNDALMKLLFNINEGSDNAYLYLCLYKILIIIVCCLMKSSIIQDKSLSLFYSILNNKLLAQIFINPTNSFTVNRVNAKQNLFNALNGSSSFLFTVNNYLIRQFNLQLKVYYKKKYIPNYNYYIYGYFEDNSTHISKVGLRPLEQYINYVKNDIFNPHLPPIANKFTTYIQPLTDFCIQDEEEGNGYDISDNTRLTFKPYSIVDISNATINSIDYLDYNYYFMFTDSIYPNRLDFNPRAVTIENQDDRIDFIKGNIRSLKKLMLEERIFSKSSIVFLMSCAVDYNSSSTPREVGLADEVSDDEQEVSRKKYLKYKKKYLALKKKLNL